MFFSVAHLFWHGTSVYNVHFRASICCRALTVELSQLRSFARLGFEHPTFACKAIALTDCATASALYILLKKRRQTDKQTISTPKTNTCCNTRPLITQPNLNVKFILKWFYSIKIRTLYIHCSCVEDSNVFMGGIICILYWKCSAYNFQYNVIRDH